MNPALSLRLLVATLALTSVAASACSSSDATAVASGAAPASTTQKPAPLCRKGVPSSTATSGHKVILSRGVGWTYEQKVPATYDGAKPVSLVLELGGAGTTGAAGGSVDRGAIVLAVDGPADGSSWTGDPDELRFVKDLLLRAETSLCFDRSAIYVVGSGDGEVAAERVLQDIPGTVRPR